MRRLRERAYKLLSFPTICRRSPSQRVVFSICVGVNKLVKFSISSPVFGKVRRYGGTYNGSVKNFKSTEGTVFMLQNTERNGPHFLMQVTPAGAAALQNLPGPAGCISAAGPSAHRQENGRSSRIMLASRAAGGRPDAPVRRRTAAQPCPGRGATGPTARRGADPPVLNENYTQLRHFLRMALQLGHRTLRQLPHLGH